MTSYTQNDYYFNKIDALSCNNRPISSTLRGKSTFNAYESQTEDETISYDLYGNQEYNDGSSYDSSKYNQRTTSTTSNAGNYNDFYYCNDYNRYSKHVITTDNLMYHRDVCSGDSNDRYDIYSTLDYGDYDNLRGECFNYGSNAQVDESGRQLTSLGDSNNKMLPQVPQVQHAHNVWDGTYCSGQHRQSNVSLPSTPTFRYYESSVGGRDMDSKNGDWDRGLIANGIQTHMNGYRFYDQNGGGLNGHKLPERMLPLPQSQSYVKKSLKQQFFHETLDDMAANTTSMSAYRNPINLEFKKAMPVSSANQNLPSRNPYYDNGGITEQQESNYNNSYDIYESRYSIDSRPHTAMQTTEEYNEFGLNSMDNMSTYSDSTVPTGATTYANQQKLQDLQKCRYSIIMAMTTASVIASGETRIPQHLLKKTPKTSANLATSIETTSGLSKLGADAGMTSNNSLSYDDSSGFVNISSNNKINSLSGSNNLTPCAYANVTMIPNQSLVNLPQTAAASSSILLLSSASPIVANDTVGHTTSATTATSSNTEMTSDLSINKNFTSRKLPKHHTSLGLITSKQLPQSPQYSLVNSSVSSKTLPVTPQGSSIKATTTDTETLDSIKIESSILSTTLPSTTSSSISSTFSLLSYPGSTSLASSSFTKSTAATESLTAGTPSTMKPSTTTSYLFPNNNNTELNTEMKNYENLTNYKNNNFFCNSVQSISDKYSIEALRDSKQTNLELEKMTEEEDRKQKEDAIYHFSMTPSRLSSLESPTSKLLQPSHQYIHDSILAPPSSLGATTKGDEACDVSTTAPTTTTLATTTTSSALSDTKSMIFTNSDYKTTYDFDYSDYLKSYTLPTCLTRSNSNDTNLQYTLTNTSSNISSTSYLPYPSLDIHSSYLAFSSPRITDTSITSPTGITSLPSPTSTTATTSNNLAINNRELNKFTALNLSDNINRKSSISSPVSKIASPSESVVPTLPISCHSTTPAIATTLSTVTTSSSSSQASKKTDMSDPVSTSYLAQLQQEENDNSNLSLDPKTDTKMSYSSSSLYILNDYDYYLKDYKLDFISPSKTSSSELSSATHTSATTSATLISTTASSSPLNKSWPTSTISTTLTTTDTTTNSLNNNEVADISSTALLSSAPNCLFTTTKTIAPTAEVTSTKDGSLALTAASLTSALYTDYLKDYSTVTASSSTSFVSDLTGKSSTELPAYVMDFLVTSQSNEFDSTNYLNLYKIQEVDTITDTFTLDISSLKTTNNNNLISNSENVLSDIPSTAIPDASDADKAAIVKEEPVTEIVTTTLPAVTTFTTSDSVTTSSPIHIAQATAATTIPEHQLTANTALNSVVDFDDNFYSSFSVNLNSLMGDTTATIANSAEKTTFVTSDIEQPSSQLQTSFIDASVTLDYTTSDNTSKSPFATNAINSTTSTSFKPVETPKTTSEAAVPATTTIKSSITSSKPTTTSSSQKPSIAGSKATSMLGGLSQSLKGGLDGVLAVAGSNEPQQQKRGFGFGLASKLVPNVGGLLGSAGKSTAASTAAERQSSKVVATSSVAVTTQQSLVSSESLHSKVDAISTASVTCPQDPVTSSQSEYYLNDVTSNQTAIITTSDNKDLNYVISQPQSTGIGRSENDAGGSGGIYYNSSQPTYYHMTSSVDYAQDEVNIHTEQMMMYDDAVTGDYGEVKGDYYVDENQAIDMYDGYSEYSAVATSGHLVDTTAYMSAVTSGHLVDTTAYMPAATSGHLIDTTAYLPAATSGHSVDTSAAMVFPTSSELASTAVQLTATTAPVSTSKPSTDSSTVTAAKKATSSLFSSLTNVASQISNQTSTPAPAATSATATTYGSTTNATSTKATSGGGMFGSIFGKAAAAMQTATQVVNQGASMASTKVQKNLQPSSAATGIKQMAATEESTTCVVTRTENVYQRSALSQQNSLASPYASSLGGDDYDNSNIPKTDSDYDHQLQKEEYYYANQSQPTQLVHQQSQQKVLPTVPPGGGSTGKKLPTINDKSGCLVKQQPTEIYDEDTQVLDNKSQSYLKRVPTYDIDSEQADYYMDAQPVAPSARHMAANSYYEHTNGGSYDYRDDYFNEEDELNYLEKEKILDNKQQQQQQLRQIHKQTSVQYVVDDGFPEEQNDVIDEYIEDMYHSEDSGNYLDESSSGSVKGLTTHQQMPTTTVATSLQNAHLQAKSAIAVTSATTTTLGPISSHQQIKKQDSIILEEEEKEGISTVSGHPETAASPSKSLSRKSSYDILGAEDDQMGDLKTVSSSLRSSQSRKMKLMRGETEEVVSGHMQIMKRKTEVTAKQRWHWAYNKIIMQLNVSTNLLFKIFTLTIGLHEIIKSYNDKLY